ncbi:hypothetical protein Bmayo_04785 (plasmid) [Borreliella mayonii]|uniref:Uncharacterized protein n=1 Tax=Borreliella mayonii TaxID=1674146 RepID=A0AAC9KZD8_9SPIR|nr:hypothetical protein A7X70_05595 [Borreliella mayonii]APT00401.1 hypothetical protein Bmayo_04785 [Borreliella mayonii]
MLNQERFLRIIINLIIFTNLKKRFQGVHSSFKFAIFQLSNTKVSTSSFKAKFMIQHSNNILKEITSDLKDG